MHGGESFTELSQTLFNLVGCSTSDLEISWLCTMYINRYTCIDYKIHDLFSLFGYSLDYISTSLLSGKIVLFQISITNKRL